MNIAQLASEFVSALDSEYTYDFGEYIEKSSRIARKVPDLVNRVQPDSMHAERTEYLRGVLEHLSESNVDYISRLLLNNPKKAKKLKRTKVEGHVYFIYNPGDDTVKIGHSVSPEKRLRTLQTGSAHELELLGTVRGSEGLEEELQDKFAEHHFRGEHFRMSDEIKEFVTKQ